jgi:hypothetical protein
VVVVDTPKPSPNPSTPTPTHTPTPGETPVAHNPSPTPAGSNGGTTSQTPAATPAPAQQHGAAANAASTDETVEVQSIAQVNAAIAAQAASIDAQDVASMLSSGSRYGEVSGFATAEKLRRDLRRQAIRVQTIREFIAIDPEHNAAELAAFTARATSGQTSADEAAGQAQEGQQQHQQQTIAAASLSRNFTTESTSTRSINILAAVAAGASVLAARYQRWRKRRLAEAAAARLASMLQFDPLAAWLDDDNHRRG